MYLKNHLKRLARRGYHGRKDDNNWLISSCFGPDCYKPERMTQFCDNSRVHLMKELELGMEKLEEMVKKFNGPGFKVVFYIRDPRGVYNSRHKLKIVEHNLPSANEQEICVKMSKDWDEFTNLQKKYPGTFTLLRYEDLALNPMHTAERLFDTLALDFDDEIRRWIREATNATNSWQDVNPEQSHEDNFDQLRILNYQTKRDSIKVPMQWAKFLPWEMVNKIQSFCGTLMNEIGYKLVSSEEQLKSLMDPYQFYI